MRVAKPNKVIAALYRHGCPPTIGALAALLAEDQRMQNWRDYMASMSCIIANKVARGKKRIPMLSELEKQSSGEPVQTGQEIFDGVITAALGGKTDEAI